MCFVFSLSTGRYMTAIPVGAGKEVSAFPPHTLHMQEKSDDEAHGLSNVLI